MIIVTLLLAVASWKVRLSERQWSCSGLSVLLMVSQWAFFTQVGDPVHDQLVGGKDLSGDS